jgi:Domain of unknown function (DUF4157)
MTTPATTTQATATAAAPAATLWRCGGRTCGAGECQHEENELHRHASGDGPATAPDSVHDVVAGSGVPLPADVRRDAEERLGHSFDRVRIHRGTDAARSATAVGARAYTVGQHVVFRDDAYAPSTGDGRRVLFHELVHTLQDSGPGRVSRSPLRVSSPSDAAEHEAERIAQRALVQPVVARPSAPTSGATTHRHTTVNPGLVDDDQVRTHAIGSGNLWRDFALAPPRPAAVGRALTPAETAGAITFDDRVVGVVGVDGVREIRDVLGVSPEPAVIDADFVNGVVRWQAVNGLTQDGRLGPATAGRLFKEIGAEKVGRGELVSGPRYTPGGTFAPPVVAGNQQARFRFGATFKNDPANGVFASCCEARQFIRWDAASAAALPGGIPHGGFPAGTAAGTWIEDRDNADATRYGHRTGQFAESIPGDRYVDTNNRPNNAFGHIFQGEDAPGGPDALLAGSWRFMVRVIDVCNGNARLGDDFIRINW